MNGVHVDPVLGTRVIFPAWHVAIRLDGDHRRAYRRLYGLLFPLPDVPALKDRDFDGRTINVSKRQLAALNRAFRGLNEHSESSPDGAFRGQEQFLARHFKEMQDLS